MKSPFLFILLLSTIMACAQNTVEGVWCSDPNPNLQDTIQRNLSWGIKNLPRQFDIIFDLHSEKPQIEISNFAKDEIMEVIENGRTTELTFFFSRGKFNVTMKCHLLGDNTMWIEPLPNNLTFFGTGEKYIYYRIDGPK